MRTPFIGITASNTNISMNMSSSQSVTLIANSYVNIVNDFNCTPVILPSIISAEQISTFSAVLDGLILTSGQDISSEAYNTESRVTYSSEINGKGEPYNRPMLLAPDPKRDKTEIALYHAAKNKGIPILGICRGMQLINVAEGGTLFQELPESSVSHYIDPDGWIHYHSIEIVPDTLCARLINLTNYFVSSIHHQGIEKIAEDLQISAFADDGIAEIIEHKHADKFIMGVQGHIEKTRTNQLAFENIYKEFFKRAKSVQATREP